MDKIMEIDWSPIEMVLESQTCPEHGQHPTITIDGGTARLATCCEAFSQDIERMLSDELAKLLKGDRKWRPIDIPRLKRVSLDDN